MNKIKHSLLRRCKTLSRQLGRSSSFSGSMRSKSTRDYYHHLPPHHNPPDPGCETVFVGSSRRRYVISSKHLTHPLVSALIQRETAGPDLAVKCEVVLFDHLLWMLENADPNLSSESLEELAELYAY